MRRARLGCAGLAAILVVGCSRPAGGLPAPAAQRDIAWSAVGSGRAVVLLHGGPGLRHDYLVPEWTPLSDHARVVFYDQRGCGRSSRQRAYTWEQQLADLGSVLDQAAPRERVVLAGTSWGSWLALEYAARHPERVAGVVVTGLTPWPSGDDSTYARLPTGERARVDSLLAGMPVQPRPSPDSATVARIFAPADSALALRLGEFCRDANVALRISLRTFPPLESLRALRVPVLLVTGDKRGIWQDATRGIASVLPDGRVVELAGAGHDPWFDRPEQFRDTVASFIRSLGSGRGQVRPRTSLPKGG